MKKTQGQVCRFFQARIKAGSRRHTVDPAGEEVEAAMAAWSGLISVGGGVTESRSTSPGSSRSRRAARAHPEPRGGG
jgi:hypothetical protein